ncbi:MAG: tricarballylate utilization 4Fe-4S protein TcuB [Paracoccaceae bacterium]
MFADTLNEARRQAEICNACRYCEGFCAVFPSLHSQRAFADGDLTQMANLCHNCRGCYYACQYTEPHEFALNLPGILAEVRQESWDELAFPAAPARLFQRSGLAIALATTLGFAVLFALVRWLGTGEGAGFYAVLSHSVMVAIFLPAFLFPLLSIAVSLRRYWVMTGGTRVTLHDLTDALGAAANMRNLSGGAAEGCNFEDEDRYSKSRKHAHHAVMYGFLLCFAATSVATVLHYGFDMPAPYSIWSAPKLLGLIGGVLLLVGCLAMLALKSRADRALGDARAYGGEVGFIGLLALVSATGLALYALGQTPLMPTLLALHLGSVLAFFLLTPYSKMAHGFYRMAALVRDAQRKRTGQ